MAKRIKVTFHDNGHLSNSIGQCVKSNSHEMFLYSNDFKSL